MQKSYVWYVLQRSDCCDLVLLNLIFKFLNPGPLELTGHSAVVINDKGLKSRHSKMVVIFGHSPYYGYVNVVQEFHFGKQF